MATPAASSARNTFRMCFTAPLRLRKTSYSKNKLSHLSPCNVCDIRMTRSAAIRPPQLRSIHNASTLRAAPPPTKDRGPKSDEDTQTDFSEMNMLRNIPSPSTAIDACTDDGFHLNSGLKVKDSGVLLVAGQAFNWRPWIREGRKEGTIAEGGTGNDTGSIGGVRRVKNAKGQVDLPNDAWGLLALVWPKPDLLIIGTGSSTVPLAPETRKYINSLGIRLEVQDTRNAAAQFNLLATERGLQQVAGAMIPYGWKDGR